jgi:hypothetical protein
MQARGYRLAGAKNAKKPAPAEAKAAREDEAIMAAAGLASSATFLH